MDSTIAQTVLMDTEELAFIVDFNGVNQTFVNLQRQLSASNNTAFRGMSSEVQTGTRGDLISALKKLFTNFTLGLLADAYLQPNYSSPYVPSQEANVTSEVYHNIYTYSASTLWSAWSSNCPHHGGSWARRGFNVIEQRCL